MRAQTDNPSSCPEDQYDAPYSTRYPRSRSGSGTERVGVVAVAMAVTMAAGADHFDTPPERKGQRPATMEHTTCNFGAEVTDFAADAPARLVQCGGDPLRITDQSKGSGMVGKIDVDDHDRFEEYKKKATLAMAAAGRRGLDYADGASSSGEAEDTLDWEGSGTSKSEGPRRTPAIWEDGQCLIFGPMTHLVNSSHLRMPTQCHS